MEWLRKLEKTFRGISLIRPLIYFIACSVLYNFVLLWMETGFLSIQFPWTLSTAAISVLEVIWASCYGVGLYFVCTLVWGKRHGTLRKWKPAMVFAWCLCWCVIARWVIVPLYLWSYGNFIPHLLIQLVALLLLIVVIPTSILFFKALYEDVRNPKEIWHGIQGAYLHHLSALINPWLIVLLLIVFWDSLFYGPMAMTDGFDACLLFYNLLFMGNPCYYFMMILSFATQGTSELVLLYVISAVFFSWLELNMVNWLGALWLNDPEKKR